MNRKEAEKILKAIFGIDHFYDEQWFAIERLLRGERILMIERTGFGKSLCYQFPAILFPGLTVVFSPLIALMRDQVESLRRRNIPAAFINSEQLPEENSQVIEQARNGKLKILYIAPERQENYEWLQAAQQLALSMVVIDEAHTISTWGHDFRPAFRRIINLVKHMPDSMPILATTATATARVQSDVEQQIGGKLSTIRGSLHRENFRMYVLPVRSEDEKLLWLAENIVRLKGTGLIYTGTRVDTEIICRWLQWCSIEATEYNAGFDADTRKDIEQGLKDNRWKCIVSTNALGMGIDKPDIRFVIHTQIPQSPIHYYQEIGRAGRDGLPAAIVLFYNESVSPISGLPCDYQLPRSFIDNARPKPETYQKVIDLLKEEPLGEREIVKRANLKQSVIRIIKADLIEQGIIKEAMYGRYKKYEYQFNAPALDTSKFEELRLMKLAELDSMIGYVYSTEPRMKYLCRFLDSVEDVAFHNCDNTDLQKLAVPAHPDLIGKLKEFRDNYFPVLEVEAKGTNARNGYAASYYGVSAVGSTLHRCKYGNGGDFPDFLLRLALKAYYRKYNGIKFDLVAFVPPTRSGNLVQNFAAKFAQAAGLPFTNRIFKTRNIQEQKIFQNNYNKRDNVDGAFGIDIDIAGKNILLIDDIYDSGATLREIAKMLTAQGAATIMPLTIAKTVGGTL